MLFVETPVFTKRIKQLMSDDAYADMQQALADKPELGPVMKKSGGLRKVRWAREGEGKSGGFRVIYYYAKALNQHWMIFIFGKNEQDNLTDEQLKKLRNIVERW